jgi:transposase InsO family protein
VLALSCVLGSDNGGEFIGGTFTSLLREHGVIPWRTAPHTLEHNGYMEGFEGTLERARKGQCIEDLIAHIIEVTVERHLN